MNYNEVLTQIKDYDHFIVDEVILQLYPEIKDLLEAKKTYVVSCPEKAKNLSDYEKIIHFFIGKKISRKDTIVAIGGGALSDLAGFVAATILRGIDWVVIPTTLLAMIDASIGGKVGVNLEQGKNLVGQFHMPRNIIFCEDFLRTLSEADLVSGQGELLKYIFLSHDIFQIAEKVDDYKALIKICGEYKNDLVAKDPFEKGERAFLNLGHSFGHAIEKLTSLPHGICVYYGLKVIFSFFNEDNLKILDKFQKKFQLKFPELGKFNIDDIFTYLEQDKKRPSEREIDLILVDRIGSPYIKTFELTNLKKIMQEHKTYADFFLN